MTFDFLVEDDHTPITKQPPDFVGPNLNSVVKMTRNRFGQAILNVLQRLGGEDWIYTEAIADPKAYLELLKKMVPSPTIASELGEITVKLINRYGDAMSIETRAIDGLPATGEHHSSSASAPQAHNGRGEPGQLQIATSGNLPNIKLKERYE